MYWQSSVLFNICRVSENWKAGADHASPWKPEIQFILWRMPIVDDALIESDIRDHFCHRQILNEQHPVEVKHEIHRMHLTAINVVQRYQTTTNRLVGQTIMMLRLIEVFIELVKRFEMQVKVSVPTHRNKSISTVSKTRLGMHYPSCAGLCRTFGHKN